MKIDIAYTKLGAVEYALTGRGQPVLFLHGGHSNCHEALFHKGFNQDVYQLITPTRPGYGNTPLNGMTLPSQTADLVVALMDYLDIDKAVMYGISAGGLSAISLAANYGQRVEKLILASAVSKKWLDMNGQLYKTARIIFKPPQEKFVWAMLRLLSGFFPNTISHKFYAQFTENQPHPLAREDVQELLNTIKYFRSKSGFMNDIEQDLAYDEISQVKCPTLIIHSKNDKSVPFEHAQYAHQHIKDSCLEGLDNEWGHLFWIGRDARESIRKIIEFIEP